MASLLVSEYLMVVLEWKAFLIFSVAKLSGLLVGNYFECFGNDSAIVAAIPKESSATGTCPTLAQFQVRGDTLMHL